MSYKFSYSKASGQAAILAVMLITGVALISAGFAAFIANSIHHARALTEKTYGKDIAMYGVEYAMQQLLTSPEGADWQPVSDLSLPWDAYEQRRGWNMQYTKHRAPNGYFLLKISKRPDGYIEIDSIGRPQPKSPIYHRITAIVPQPIIQYARFLRGRRPHGQNEHVFGIGQIDFDADGQINNMEMNSCLVVINGGIFSNDNFRVASQSLIKLLFGSNNPNHGLFVSGTSTVSQASSLVLCDENGNPIDQQRTTQDSNSPNFWIFPLNNIPRYRDNYYLGKPLLVGGIDVYRRLQPIPAPTIDAERYRKLVYLGSSGVQCIYIDNRRDIQDEIVGANYPAPAQNQFWDWVNVPSETDPRRADPKSGWYYSFPLDPYRRNPPVDKTLPDYFRYVPPGCEIELQKTNVDDDRDGNIDEDPPDQADNDNDGLVDEDGGDIIVIRRHDVPNAQPIFYQVNREKVVIFAEGNVRIRGKINASLTVISMGTIYIEGSLQTENPAQQHIALLAKHNVCLNTTALLPVMKNATGVTKVKSDDPGFWDNDKIPLHYEFPDSSPSSLMWRIPRFDNQGQRINIMLLHSGLGNPQQGNISIEIALDGNNYYQGEPLHYDPDNDGKIGEDPLNNIDDDKDGNIDEDPGQAVPCYMSGSSHGIYWIETVLGSLNSITVRVVNANVPYRLSRFKVELLDANGNPIPPWNIRVNAAIYAESGCFFILRPPYFDNALNLTIGKGAERFRRFNYFDIEINGAIAEYTTARTMARSIGLSGAIYRSGLDKLAYPKYDANGDLVGWQLVRFNYDPTLLLNQPPFLPVSPIPIIIYSGL